MNYKTVILSGLLLPMTMMGNANSAQDSTQVAKPIQITEAAAIGATITTAAFILGPLMLPSLIAMSQVVVTQSERLSTVAPIISKISLSLSVIKGGYWCAGKIKEEVFPNEEQKAERLLMELEKKKAAEKPFAQQLKERKAKRLYLISYQEYQACLLKNGNNPASCPEQQKAFLDASEKYKEQ